MSSRSNALRVLFRADGGPEIGDGHLMRGLALAQHVLDRGGACHLLTADLSPRPVGKWQSEAIAVDGLVGSAGGDTDAQATIAAADKMHADFIVADGYSFTANYHARLSHHGTASLRFDDNCDTELRSDIMVNQNPGAEQRCVGVKAAQTLLGCDYVALRRGLRSMKTKNGKTTPHVLITLGGYDPENLALGLAKAIFDQEASLTATLVCAAGPDDLAKAQDWSRGYGDKVKVVVPGDIDDEMARADLAISAGGTTSLELASLGVPMLVVIRADNQRPGAKVLEEKGCALVAGEGRDAVATAAQKSVVLLRDPQRRSRMSESGRRLVDGRGVERVYDAMLDCIRKRKTAEQ